jgi:hypothetical protein
MRAGEKIGIAWLLFFSVSVFRKTGNCAEGAADRAAKGME